MTQAALRERNKHLYIYITTYIYIYTFIVHLIHWWLRDFSVQQVNRSDFTRRSPMDKSLDMGKLLLLLVASALVAGSMAAVNKNPNSNDTPHDNENSNSNNCTASCPKNRMSQLNPNSPEVRNAHIQAIKMKILRHLGSHHASNVEMVPDRSREAMALLAGGALDVGQDFEPVVPHEHNEFEDTSRMVVFADQGNLIQGLHCSARYIYI